LVDYPAFSDIEFWECQLERLLNISAIVVLLLLREISIATTPGQIMSDIRLQAEQVGKHIITGKVGELLCGLLLIVLLAIGWQQIEVSVNVRYKYLNRSIFYD